MKDGKRKAGLKDMDRGNLDSCLIEPKLQRCGARDNDDSSARHAPPHCSEDPPPTGEGFLVIDSKSIVSAY